MEPIVKTAQPVRAAEQSFIVLTPRQLSYQAVKKSIDTAAAVVGLIVLSPLLALIALAIKLDTRGPAVFRQMRVGRNGRPFAMHKFRTMRVGTPEMSKEALLQSGGMGAVTRVGWLLRRTSLDELPQLVNIALGQMSLVGPRPALPSQHNLNAARRALGIEQVLPGVTGYAQVLGREDRPLDEKVAYDADYVRNISLSLDVKILLLSVRALMTAKRAF
jgi:O-antigen biosynthesis protein WbqP